MSLPNGISFHQIAWAGYTPDDRADTCVTVRGNADAFSGAAWKGWHFLKITLYCVTYLQPFRQSTEHRRVFLSEIHDIANVELLTVRQLKELLANNFVDYKGCCEKPELVMRVQQLWTDHQRNVNYGQCCWFSALVTVAELPYDYNVIKKVN